MECKFCLEEIEDDNERIALQTGESSHKKCFEELCSDE